MEGWIKIHRSILDWEWYGEDSTFRLWVYLLLTANYEDKRWRGLTIKRGQLVTSRGTLAKETGLSEQQVRTCLARLKSTNEITINSTNKYSVITICKYNTYQIRDEGCQPTNQPTREPTINQQSTTTKEYNNTRSKEEERINKKEESHVSMFYVSSMQRQSVEFDPDKIAGFKRSEMEQRLMVTLTNLAKEGLTMTREQVTRFLDFYCAHEQGSEQVRAETYQFFSLYEKAKNWIMGDNAKNPQRKESVRVTKENRMNLLL